MNQKKPVPIQFWSIQSAVRDEIINTYPSLANQDNPLCTLGWLILDKALRGIECIPASRDWVNSWTDTNKNTNTTDLLEILQLELNNLFSIQSHKEGSNGNPGQCRQLIVNHDHPDYVRLAALYRNSMDWDSPRVALLTDKPFKYTKKSIETRKQHQKMMKQELINDYLDLQSLAHMQDYANLVNKLIANKRRACLINTNLCEAFKQVQIAQQKGHLDPLKAQAYQHSLCRLRDFVVNAYRLPSENSPRLFDLVDQNLPRHLRAIIYRGCFDLDLKRSQLTILCALAQEDGVDLWNIVSREGFWEVLIESTGLTKDQLKAASYSQIFGGNRKTLQDETKMKKEEVFTKEEVDLFQSLVYYKALRKAVNALHRGIKEKEGVVIGNKFLALNKPFNINELTCRLIQWIESMIIYRVCQEIEQDDDITLIGAYHDGVLISLRQVDKIFSKNNKLNQVAVEEAVKHGIYGVELEVK